MDDLSASRLQDHIVTVSKELRKVFPVDKMYILPTLGNHDVFPANEMSPNPHNETRVSWCRNLGTNPDLWAHWIDQFEPKNESTDFIAQHGSTNAKLLIAPPWSNFSTSELTFLHARGQWCSENVRGKPMSRSSAIVIHIIRC